MFPEPRMLTCTRCGKKTPHTINGRSVSKADLARDKNYTPYRDNMLATCDVCHGTFTYKAREIRAAKKT